MIQKFLGFEETNLGKKRPISREFSRQIFVEKQTRKQKRKDSFKKNPSNSGKKETQSSSNIVLKATALVSSDKQKI